MSCDNLIQVLSFDYPDLPPQVLQDHLVMAAQELACYELFRVTIDLSGDIQACVGTYDWSDKLPPGFVTRSILSVEWCGCCINPVDPKCHPCPNGYERCAQNGIVIHPEPASSEGLTLEVCIAVEPDSSSCDIPDHICRQFRMGLMHQVRSTISCMPNQPWTNFSDGRKYASLAKVDMRKRTTAYREEGTTEAKYVPGERWLV